MSGPRQRNQERGRIKGFRIGLRIMRTQVKDWTQKEAAVVITETARRLTSDPTVKVSQSTIAMIETGEREPSWDVASWIAAAFGMTVEEMALVDDDEPVKA